MRTKRAIAAVTTAGAIVLGGVGVAGAVPTPDRGPDTGGTTVMVSTPEIAFTSISAGGTHSLAIADSGKTYAWGMNVYGSLGDGGTIDQSTPVEVVAPSGVAFTSVSAGYAHSLAIGDNGKTYAWGANWNGQLGDGSTVDQSTPVEVDMPDGVSFTSVSAGTGHSLAIGDDGKTYGWGFNQGGQVGDGTVEARFTPVEVALPEGVSFTSVSAGGTHSVAIGDNGKLYA